MPPKRINIRPSQRLKIASSQGYRCNECKNVFGSIFHLDHKDALCLNGPDNLSNLQALCPNCHSEKTHDDMQKMWDIKKEERTGKSKYFDPYSVFYIDSPSPYIQSPRKEVKPTVLVGDTKVFKPTVLVGDTKVFKPTVLDWDTFVFKPTQLVGGHKRV
jgi:hypothetical protein